MPNWCGGVLKVRGKKRDLLNFINDGIERYGYPRDENGDYTKYPLDVHLDDWGDLFIKETDNEHLSWLYFKNSRRLFIAKNIECYLDDDTNRIQILVLDIKQAWRIDPEYFVDISKKYNIDFKMECFEQGCCFIQKIEVIKGRLKLNKVKEYKSCKNYNWEVYDPRLGG